MGNALEGRRILLTRERAENGPLVRALKSRGAQPVVLPAIETVAHEPENGPEVLRSWNRLRWVAFASKNGARFFRAWLDASRRPLPPHILVAAVGPGTAAACVEAGFPPQTVPDTFTGADLGAHLVGREAPCPILLPRGIGGREELAGALAAAGWEVFTLAVYQTRRAAPAPEAVAELEAGVDAAVFASPSAVKSLVEQLPLRARRALQEAKLVPIGPTTAAALEAAGMHPATVPGAHTPEGILSALEALFADG